MCFTREEAEDLVQDTFARVLQKPRFLHSEDDIGYLLRVLRNTFVSGYRKASRRPRSEAFDELKWIDNASAGQPEARLDRAALFQAVAALPPPFRDALIAVDVIGFTYAEASRELRVGEATITSRLHRARQRVAATLAEESNVAPAVLQPPPASTARAA